MTQSPITGREPQLIGEFQEKKGGLRRLSLRRLGTMLNVLPPDAVSLDAAREMLKSEDFYVRFNAAKILSKRGDREARVVMEEALKNGELRTRASVARHLYGFSWFAAEPLIRLALQDEDPRVREGAVYALCDLRQLSAYSMLVDVLKGEEDSVLEAAATGLRDCQDPAAVPVLEIVMQAEDPDVRVKALEALGVNGHPDTMPIVHEAMNDPAPHVKYAATLSLLELAGESWLEELSGVIGRTNGETLKQVLLGFFHATNYLKINVAKSQAADLMIDALETALLDEMPEARKAAIWPLAWMRHERMPGILKRTYQLERDPDVKAHIVRVAAGLMSEASEEILADALKSETQEVKKVADDIIHDRETSGRVLTYDHSASEGIAFKKASLGK
jgi:HEAT repeat protein